jgi:hypothetical protein
MSNQFVLLFLFFFLLALVGIAGIGVGVVVGLVLGERKETQPRQSSGEAEQPAMPVLGPTAATPEAQKPSSRRSPPAWTIALAIAVMIFCCCCTLLVAVMASAH